MKHKLLLRQIKKYLGELKNIPPQWEGFLNAVDSAYNTYDEDYALLEHTMDVSSEENLEKGTKIEWLSRLPKENPHPVLRISKDGDLLYFNPASLPLLQLSNATPTKALPPEWQKMARDAFEQHANRIVELEFSGRYFSLTFSPVEEHSYVNVYAFEITERKTAENYLLDHNIILGNLVAGKPFQEILDGLCQKVEKYSDGLLGSIFILDKSKKILTFGSAPSLPADYLRGTKTILLGPKQGSCGTAAFLKKTIVVEDISQDPLWEKFKDLPLSNGLRACWSFPIMDFEEHVLGTFAVYYTQPRKPNSAEVRLIRSTANLAALAIQNHHVKDDLKMYAEELKRSNSDLQDFAYIASHDLQEPLRKISIFSDRLQEARSQLSERHQGYLSRMGNAAERMQALIDDLLQLSQVTAKGKPFQKVDLTEISHIVIDDLEARLAETQGKVILGDLPRIEADPSQMQQLLQNLIENALKYHQPGIPPVVKLNSQPSQNGSWSISVQDNGIGLDEKFSERIFVPLERLHGRTAYEGTGIGLAICKKIVSRHGGSISVESQMGEGSTFTVTLPKRQPATT
ncbi:MAG: GAF domain-containing protein [Nitrospina sp.]|jgi:signal transduction histidine kinase|nr:GAF domain-containing protein [Nitrospina sp.]MBT3508440.1 GAF domain-containing protein [Nitrospina sp.]MBT3876990.1 GAF domain-containing protein [Nitrospina sp.]MBT4048815.1 GAF domain-containing protein [Nitrospina sp.]MBT4556132.1 GAF domain-containing protein [Nitrospina sp.]